MTYNQHSNTFSFHQFIKAKPPKANWQVASPTDPSGNPLVHNANPDIHIMLNKIDVTTYTIKKKTIDLVKTLRQYSLPGNLESQIEAYLTDVLDQMDLLQVIDSPNPHKPNLSQLTYEPVPFLQMEKLEGDQEDCYLEDTLKQLKNNNINNVRSQKQQAELKDKIDNILKSISQASIEEELLSQEARNNSQAIQPNKVNQPKARGGAHRFSQLYIRDVQKPKRSKVL